MKNFIALFLIICMVTVFAGCELDDSTASTGSSQQATESGNNPVVLVDNESIKATYINAYETEGLGAFYVTIKVENKMDSDIVITLDKADVDGETIPLIATGVPLVIRPGNSGQTGFIFSMVNLSISSLADANKATFSIVARNNETYETVYESELVTIDLH